MQIVVAPNLGNTEFRAADIMSYDVVFDDFHGGMMMSTYKSERFQCNLGGACKISKLASELSAVYNSSVSYRTGPVAHSR